MAKLYFYYGTMNSSKTLDLLRTNFSYKERGMNPVLMKSYTDIREGSNECIIKSRAGLSAKGLWIYKNINLYKYILELETKNKVDVLIIDEVQFLTKEQIEQLQQITIKLKIPVLAYGLKNNFKGELFGDGIVSLLALADNIQEIKSICHCGKLAKQNARVINGQILTDGEIVVMGGNDKHISLCNKCYYEKNLGR
ncbi:thymidine kinase [Clostridium sp. M14]|uniref:thymidine kinase n=1 Tax=Clostridium sp. M14 TaxID=2716311 RepID=UPI0013EE6CCB|nr:thymidine kinase [Clostridium sp. M14]MBZ9693273.1 thymidine kinase [Clostridium sp. M14]